MARPPITRANPRVVSGRLFTTEREYRNYLAQRRGYPSFAAERRESVAAFSTQELSRLTPVQQAERRDALDLLARVRRGEDVDLAVIFARIDPARAQRHVAGALYQESNGKWRASARDRLPRPMFVLTPGGWEPVVVRDSRTASRLGEHASAVRQFAEYGDIGGLRPFRGRWFQAGGRRYRLLDDRDEAVLRRLVRADVLNDLQDLYQDGLIATAGFT